MDFDCRDDLFWFRNKVRRPHDFVDLFVHVWNGSLHCCSFNPKVTMGDFIVKIMTGGKSGGEDGKISRRREKYHSQD